MIFDRHNRYSDAQDITASAPSDDLIDLGIERRPGTGENIYLVAIVDTAFTDAGSDSTVTITVESDDDAGFGSATTVFTLGTFGALAAAGSRLIARLPAEALFEQFHRLQFTVANGNLTTGAITAFLTHDIDAFTAYQKGYTIS
jgi:hypothetical protein